MSHSSSRNSLGRRGYDRLKRAKGEEEEEENDQDGGGRRRGAPQAAQVSRNGIAGGAGGGNNNQHPKARTMMVRENRWFFDKLTFPNKL